MKRPLTAPTGDARDGLTGHRVARARIHQLQRRIFAPPPKLSLSEWAEQYRILPPESPEPGRWRTSRVPYLREIMDACSDAAVETVVFKKSAQVGFTDGLVNNLVGYYIDQLPSPILVLQPTVEDAKDWSKEKLDPMLRVTPRLRGKVKESGRRDSKNTIRLKMFPGGFLAAVGSNSAAGLRRRAVRVVIADEVDGYGVSAKGSGGKKFEGDPLTLAVKRTENFRPRKILEGSTPTVKGFSRIERDFELSDQRHYYVPCPHCGYTQTLRFKNFHWEHRDPDTVVYLCGEMDDNGKLKAGCGRAITEEHKTWMVSRGAWRAHRPGRRVRGYFIWAAYSLLSADGWRGIVRQFLEAEGNTELLQVFVNTVLGETWEERGAGVKAGMLAARREHYGAEVPAGVAILTAGVDTQGDRLEVSVWGWGADEESYLIRHEALWGDPGQADVWQQLDAFRTKAWLHELGPTLRIRRMAIDSGGHHTDEVYRYCKARRSQGVYAIKGEDTVGRAAIAKPSKGNRAGVLLWRLGTTALKDRLFSRLHVTARGPRYVHFPWVDEEYFRQLTAEVVRTRYVNKRPVRRYEKTYERNEALDCAIYADAALLMMGPLRDKLGALAAALRAATAEGEPPPADGDEEDAGEPPPPPPPRRRSKWVQGWR